MVIGLFVVGLALLVVGAEALVRGAGRLAAAIGISPLVIGLTVVAFGTSSPELAVSLQSAWSGDVDVAIGNIVGSNICNILLILGLSAVIAPLVVSQQLVWLEVPLMIGISLGTWLMALNGVIGRAEGLLLFGGIVAYTVYSIWQSRRENQSVTEEYRQEFGTDAPSAPAYWWFNLALILAGLGMLILGSRWLVNGAVTFAELLGVNQLVVGLTIVALGTSLPELATSVVASLRNERDIAVGNVVGSNLFNLMVVLGLSGVLAPQGIPVSRAALQLDLPVMIAATVACLPIFFTGHLIARWEGLLFVGYYIAYLVYLGMAAVSHQALDLFGVAMTVFVLPLTGITLLIGVGRALAAQRKQKNFNAML